MITNKEVRQRFQIMSELLLLHGTDENLAKSLGGASYRIGQMHEPVTEMDTDELKKQFRREIVKLISEISETGSIETLDELIQLTPAGVFDMMRIKGLGGKKLSVIWKTAGIDSTEKLLVACKKHKLSEMPGFGKKTEENIISSIEQLRNSENQFHYGYAAEEAFAAVGLLTDLFDTTLVSLCGEIRRKSNTFERIEILAAISEKALIKNNDAKKFFIIKNSSEESASGHTINELPFTIYFCDKKDFTLELFTKTGNADHVKNILSKIKGRSFDSEKQIYSDAGFRYIEPELRENIAEWNFEKNIKSRLITAEDIRGVVHNHTTYSDGIDSLRDFVLACRDKNYEYVVISDHSKNAHYAGGLKEDKVLKQHEEIDELNKELAPFKIFKSIECDILVSGDLDYSDDFLDNFDLVITSVHQLLKMDEERATNRLIKAIENRHTTILGHMTGRQLLIRPGYPVNYKKVIDACAANNVVIEINANPYRLDVDWRQIPYILEKGIMISINPDAHSISEIDNIQWGVDSARKGGLTPEMTWNAQSLRKIEEWISKKHHAVLKK
jgi:DNA polymerase (family 10)